MNRSLPKAFFLCFIFLLVLYRLAPFPLGASAVHAADETKKPDVAYEPSPENVVEKMLEMAEVGKDDTVYDLGSGDGRIVIAAAKRGARGIGIEIDPELIEESRFNAEKAGVADRVRFLEQDLFESDISDADVVTLFLFPSVNLRLRPKLLEELDPGTRIVSHEHKMGGWRPDRSAKVDRHDIHFWVIPANVTGSWKWTEENGESRQLRLEQQFQNVSGTLSAGRGRIPLKNVGLLGDRLEFTAEKSIDGRLAPTRYQGRVSGHMLEGKWESGGVSGAWSARRDPATAEPLAGPASGGN